METKPLNALAVEACGFDIISHPKLPPEEWWMTYPVCGVMTRMKLLPFHTDDAAALELLKAWQKAGLMREMSIYYDRLYERWRVRVLDRGMPYHAHDQSLARAICLALVAAKESH